jgi:hypothetical protein
MEKIIIRLYRDGYLGETIAQAIGEDRTYVEFVLDTYFGQVRHGNSTYGPALAIGESD